MRDTPTFVVLYDTMYYVCFYSVYLYMVWRIERGRRSWLAWFCYLYKSFWRFLRRFGKRFDSLLHILCVVSGKFIVHVDLFLLSAEISGWEGSELLLLSLLSRGRSILSCRQRRLLTFIGGRIGLVVIELDISIGAERALPDELSLFPHDVFDRDARV